jgi:cell division transport system permease protein
VGAGDHDVPDGARSGRRASGLGNAARSLNANIGNRITVQIVEANPDVREAQSQRVISDLRKLTGVLSVQRISEEEMERLLEPWIGNGGLEGDLPVPAMIDAELSASAYRDDLVRERAVARRASRGWTQCHGWRRSPS